ncbi:hypothetical protein HNP60_003637 [Sphingobium sp. B1D3A]|uniref:Uncharacterized protein n=1 Tax=Sphingobium lignivorans TaxID=2735886 RepID=A0ABR6NK50_9SPHN|nr:hypothetical protein [Sphingobium lignivorans]
MPLQHCTAVWKFTKMTAVPVIFRFPELCGRSDEAGARTRSDKPAQPDRTMEGLR